jgi:hypothetical protein
MEKHLGRILDRKEIVHHIDHNKRNNDISNLMVMTQSEHNKLHARERKEKAKIVSGHKRTTSVVVQQR